MTLRSRAPSVLPALTRRAAGASDRGPGDDRDARQDGRRQSL